MCVCINQMKDKKLFLNIIKSRDRNSANGPDGISYEALQCRADFSAEYFAILSSIMLKYNYLVPCKNDSIIQKGRC